MYTIISILLLMALLYVLVGLVFTAIFIFRGLEKIDEATQNASAGFKIIIIPGCIVLWPFLLKKWIHASRINK